jgi:redox-sensitive bicupin YhaK (pirin superfamily)
MIKIRKSEERGHANHGWLDSYHTFSFADYYDPQHMGFRDLRVINQDRIEGGMGFGTHSHNNMEIISYVLEGALAHKDSMGTSSVIVPGDVQRMSAGTGVSHSEFNNLPDKATRFLQIWILPEKKNIQPGYEQKNFSREDKLGRLRLVASRDGREGSVSVNQDLNLYASVLEKGQELSYPIPAGRHVWIHVAAGSVKVNNEYELKLGDAVAASDEKELRLSGLDNAEILLFDLN